VPRFQVSTRGRAPIEVEAGNWLTALGLGLDQLGAVDALDRLACEVLPNATVIARDARSGMGFIVLPLRPVQAPDPDDEPTDVHEADSADLTFAMAEGVEEFEEEDTADLTRRLVRTLIASLAEARSELEAWVRALDIAQELIPAESGAALRVEPDGSLQFVAATGPKAADVRGVRLDKGTGFVGFCVRRGVGLVVTRPQNDPRFYGEMDRATGYETSSVMCVPVRGDGGEVLGCLELLNAPKVFSRADQDRAEEVAGALSARLLR
jgi:hypothetical protein